MPNKKSGRRKEDIRIGAERKRQPVTNTKKFKKKDQKCISAQKQMRSLKRSLSPKRQDYVKHGKAPSMMQPDEKCRYPVVTEGGVQAYIIVDDYARALAFYKAVFGVAEVFRLEMSDASSKKTHTKKVVHAELILGGVGEKKKAKGEIIGRLRICEANATSEFTGPSGFGLPSKNFFVRPYFYHSNCDDIFAQAISNGAISAMPPTTYGFSGERSCAFTDPCGIFWTIITRVEEVSPKETELRFYQQLSARQNM